MGDSSFQFDTVLLSNMDTIRRVGVRYSIPSRDLDDFVQETVYRAYSAQESLRDPRQFPGWLTTIARNLALNWLRRKQPELMDVLPETPVESPFRDGRNELSDALAQVMETLDPIDRDLLFSYYTAETPYAELQQRYRLSYSAVAQRIRRAKTEAGARVRRILASRPHPIPRSLAAADVANGSIFLFGGWTRYLGNAEPRVEEFDPTSRTWTRRKDMPTARVAAATCVLNARFYVVGGAKNRRAHGALEAYDPQTDTWEVKCSMPTPRAGLGVAQAGGKIFAIGGSGDLIGTTQINVTAVVEMYDPMTDRWTRKQDMPTPRSLLRTCFVNGKIYAIGGCDSRFVPVAAIEEYDPGADRWTRKSDMPFPRYGATIHVNGGKIYVFGGFYPRAIFNECVDEYDPATDSWRRMPPMPVQRCQHISCAVGGAIYLIGGRKEGWTNMKEVEEYRHITPSAKSYDRKVSLRARSTEHS